MGHYIFVYLGVTDMIEGTPFPALMKPSVSAFNGRGPKPSTEVERPRLRVRRPLA
jgi:hypothetical protein